LHIIILLLLGFRPNKDLADFSREYTCTQKPYVSAQLRNTRNNIKFDAKIFRHHQDLFGLNNFAQRAGEHTCDCFRNHQIYCDILNRRLEQYLRYRATRKDQTKNLPFLHGKILSGES
jgi:hypothetical protein